MSAVAHHVLAEWRQAYTDCSVMRWKAPQPLLPTETSPQHDTIPTATGRHPTWRAEASYTLVRAGEPLDSIETLRRLAAHGELRLERHVYVFRLSDPTAGRNVHMPLFEAVHRVAGRWVLAQKGHLHAMYRQAGHTDRARAWGVLEDGQPYWVDRYAFRFL